MNLPRMSLSGGVMILVIVVIRALAINKLPKKSFLALWGVAAARLLIPYSLPSAFSVYSLLGRFAAMGEAVNDIPAVRFAPVAPAYHVALVPGTAAAEPPAVHADPWTVVWAAGALACAAFFAVAYIKCRGEFRASIPVDNEHAKLWLGEHRIHRAIEIRQSGRIRAPLTYGVLRPVILMPRTADWEDMDTLKYVLAHEYVHIRRFDAVTKPVLAAILCVHWFNPAVWIMYVLANRDIELSCDEAVIRLFGERTKSAYAMALIRMEETRSGLSPLCSNFSKNAVEERIIAIMKIKKTSLAALTVAAALVVGVTTAFATSAKADDNLSDKASDPVPGMSETVTQVTTMTSYVDPRDGKTYYSLDGGETFETLTDEEFKARFSVPNIEWWTYDEYKAWLENEKGELQDMIGERGWTSGRGEFVWTQEIVDETVAMYEEILENIKNGMLYSKPIEGESGLYDMSVTVSLNPADMEAIYEGAVSAADFLPYVPYGLEWDESENALFWNGKRVRCFLDGTCIDGSGGMAVRLEYADAELKGEIDVRAVRARVDNPDGSFDPMGPLLGLEQYSQAEFDVNTLRVTAGLEAETCTAQEIVRESKETQSLLKAYTPFGMSYRIHPVTGEISANWQGKPVHSVYDPVQGVWIANSLRGLDLGSDAVDLEAVYEQGELIGLLETEVQPVVEISYVAEGDTLAEQGTSFAERFERYAPFGITYEEASGAGGTGNVYYNGELVSRFADLTPDGGAFTFSSAKQGGIAVRTVYDESGRLAGAEAVTE